MGKYVYVCGLDGILEEEVSDIDLIPCEDRKTIFKMSYLFKKAPFTKRITQEEGQVVIGSSNYVPLCRIVMIIIH